MGLVDRGVGSKTFDQLRSGMLASILWSGLEPNKLGTGGFDVIVGSVRKSALWRALGSALTLCCVLMLFWAAQASAASPPSIESVSVSGITEHDATLEAQINTYGLDTAYEFQIDTNGSYNYTKPNCPLGMCDSISVGEPLPAGLVEPRPEYIPAGSGDRSVSLDLVTIGTTLQPGTTYHYKVIASNYSGPTVEGPDQTFTTPEDMVQPLSTNTTTSSPSGADQPAGPSNGGQPAGSGGPSSSSPSSPTLGVGVLGAETGKASEPKRITAPAQSRVLVSFSEEGGLAYQYTSLVVSTHRDATVTRKGRTVRFQLDRARWSKLNAILKHTDLSAVAGDYPASPGAADYMTYVISVGRHSVRATDISELPERVSHEVEPLRQVLEEIVAVGRRRLPRTPLVGPLPARLWR